MRFEFFTPTRILFGSGMRREIGTVAKTLGHRALLVTGHEASRAAELRELLDSAGIAGVSFPVSGEPSTRTVQNGTGIARLNGCDFVIGFGGGSAIDCAKAIAALLANGGDLLDYLEIIGRGKPLLQPSAPCVAIPTTAGTGAEVTRNAVLASPEQRVKVSMRSPFMAPRVAIVDPELTLTLPAGVTANTGLDALTQLIEPLVCNRSNPMTDVICGDGIARIARSLRVAYSDGQNLPAREDMSIASLFGGLALSNAGLGAVHGFAGPIGGMFNAPHGAVCAALLPHVMEQNIQALRRRAPEFLRRYDEVALFLTGNPNARVQDGVQWVQKLTKDLAIPGLGAYGIKSCDIESLVEKAQRQPGRSPADVRARPGPQSPATIRGSSGSPTSSTYPGRQLRRTGSLPVLGARPHRGGPGADAGAGPARRRQPDRGGGADVRAGLGGDRQPGGRAADPAVGPVAGSRRLLADHRGRGLLRRVRRAVQ